MKKILNSVFILTIMSTMVLTSCKKDVEGCTDSSATNYNADATKDDGSCTYAAEEPDTYIPSFSGEYAFLGAIKTMTPSPMAGIELEFGTAVALFMEADGTTMDAGAVSVDGEDLKKQGNNTYVYIPGATNPTGIDFNSNSVGWQGSGGDWPLFTANTFEGFATVESLEANDVSLASDYTVESDGVFFADSVLFAIAGPNDYVYVVVPGNTNSHTFTSAELSGLGTGNGMIQVVGLNYENQTIDGKSYWMVNETVRTENIKVTN